MELVVVVDDDVVDEIEVMVGLVGDCVGSAVVLGTSVVVLVVTAVGAADGRNVVLGSTVVVDVPVVGADVGAVVTGCIKSSGVGKLVGNGVTEKVGAWDGSAVSAHSSGSPSQHPTGPHVWGHVVQSLVPVLSALLHS